MGASTIGRTGRRGTAALGGFTAAGALLALGLGVQSPAAAVSLFGSGCSASGSVIAEGGDLDLLGVVANDKSFSVNQCSGASVDAHGTVYGRRATGGDNTFDYSFAQGARAGSDAAAGLGVLRASTVAVADSTPKEYWYTDAQGDSHVIGNEYLAHGKSNASAYWFDQLQVQQGSAPYGRIFMRFTLQLSGSESVVPADAGDTFLSAQFAVDDDRNVSDRTISLTAPGSVSFEAGYFPGTVIKLSGSLGTMSEVRAGGKVQNGLGWWVPGGPYIAMAEALANASNTAGFQVEVLTAGAGYSSASGRSYVAMVPEPSAYAMLGLGGVLVLLGARRQRRR